MSRGEVVFICDATEVASGSAIDTIVPAVGAIVDIDAPPFGETRRHVGRYKVSDVLHRVLIGPDYVNNARSTVFVTLEKTKAAR